MPTYDYRCQKCDQVFEAVQSMKDDRFKTCPEALCKNADGWGKGEVTRLLGTGAGLIFKGSGFYITDYRSQNYKDGAKKDAPAKSEGSGSSGGGDAKPATPAAPAKTDGGSGGGSAKTSSSGGGSSSSSPAAS